MPTFVLVVNVDWSIVTIGLCDVKSRRAIREPVTTISSRLGPPWPACGAWAKTPVSALRSRRTKDNGTAAQRPGRDMSMTSTPQKFRFDLTASQNYCGQT